MASGSSGPPVVTFFLLILFIQGNYGNVILGRMLGDEAELSPTSVTPPAEGNSSSMDEALWNERMKKPWFRMMIKNATTIESDHRDENLTDISSSLTFLTGSSCNIILERTFDDEAEHSTKTMMQPAEEGYSTVDAAMWYERTKMPWFRTTVKSARPIESDYLEENKRENSLNMTRAIGTRGFLGDNWNDRMKNILVSITALIPPIGGIPIGKCISALLKAFWPSSEKDIWSLIKDQVEGLIDKKILEYELQERNNEIRALQKTMQMYVEAQMREKGSLMSSMIHASNELFFKLTQSSNSVQLIPLVVTHSVQHLTILKERLVHGKEMYNEDNTPAWRKDLESQISSYKDYIKDIYGKWIDWRNSKIILDVGVKTNPTTIPPFFVWEPYGNVNDDLTGDSARYRYNPIAGPDDKDYFRDLCEATKQNMFGLRNGELMQILVTSFYLDNFIPGKEDNPSVVPPSMSKATFGPMSPYIGGGTDSSRLYTPGDDNTRGGDVTKINVREWNIIDGFQVFYSTHTGSFFGNSGGGLLHELPLTNRRVKSMQFCQNNCNQVEVTIGFSNGDSTGRLGNRGGWRVECYNTGGIDTFGLYNIRATGWGCAQGLFQIGLDYKAYVTKPSEMDSGRSFFVDLSHESFQYASAIEEGQTK